MMAMMPVVVIIVAVVPRDGVFLLAALSSVRTYLARLATVVVFVLVVVVAWITTGNLPRLLLLSHDGVGWVAAGEDDRGRLGSFLDDDLLLRGTLADHDRRRGWSGLVVLRLLAVALNLAPAPVAIITALLDASLDADLTVIAPLDSLLDAHVRLIAVPAADVGATIPVSLQIPTIAVPGRVRRIDAVDFLGLLVYDPSAIAVVDPVHVVFARITLYLALDHGAVAIAAEVALLALLTLRHPLTLDHAATVRAVVPVLGPGVVLIPGAVALDPLHDRVAMAGDGSKADLGRSGT